MVVLRSVTRSTMILPENMINTSPAQFIEEDLKSSRAKERFLKRSAAAQVAKVMTFLLGHNSDCFAAEPVYGPTGRASLKSRGVEGLEQDAQVLRFLESPAGKNFIKSFRSQILRSIQETA